MILVAVIGAALLLFAGGAAVAVAPPVRRMIVGRARADGVCAKLQLFLADWEANGPFDLAIGADGGVRTDAAKQLAYFNSGASKAKTLAETPHGRGGALDCYPVIEGRIRGLTEADGKLPEVRAWFAQIGAFGKSRHGLTWGGDFRSFYDGPHLEDPNWRHLPMPPTGPRIA